MRRVSVQELKLELSAYLAAAERGEQVVVTRHGTPIARIVKAEPDHCYVGKKFGKGTLQPLFSGELAKRALEILAEDREDRTDRCF